MVAAARRRALDLCGLRRCAEEPRPESGDNRGLGG